MSNEPIITITGNLTGDPELRFTPSGAAVANFTVAQTPRVKQGDEFVDGETMFFNCSAWRDLGENVAESLTRGTRVNVTGRLKVRSYEKRDGGTGQSLDIDVDEVGPSLRFATAKVTRAAKGGGGGFSGGGQRNTGADPWASSGPAQGGQSAPQGQRAPAGGGQRDPWGGGGNDEPPF